VRLPVDKVCIKNLKVKVCLRSNDASSLECCVGSVTVCVDVDEKLRGAHVSRSVEAVFKVFNGSVHSGLLDLQLNLKKVAEELLAKHGYSSKAGVGLKIKLLQRVEGSDFIPVALALRTSVRLARRGDERYSVGIAFEGMSVCPCTQQVYSFLEGTPVQHTPSHSQRAVLSVYIESPTPVDIDGGEIVKALTTAFSSPVKNLLKRDDEFKLIKKAFENPKFAEDIAREAMYTLYRILIGRLSPESKIAVKVLSFESVHPYNLYVEVRGSVEELGKVFSSTGEDR